VVFFRDFSVATRRSIHHDDGKSALPNAASFLKTSRKPMERIRKFLEPVLQNLPEPIRELWLVILGLIALAILGPLAWYQRHNLRRLVGLPRRQPREEPKLDEDLTVLPPPPPASPGYRLAVEGVPARLRLVVVAPVGKGATLEEKNIEELLNQVRYGLGPVAREDQAVVRVWPGQLSTHGFPALFQRKVNRGEPDDQPSRWVLLAGPTPPRPRPFLLGLALLTEASTNIGRLTMDGGQWIRSLHIELGETPEAAPTPPAGPAAPNVPTAPLPRAPGVGVPVQEHIQPAPKPNGVSPGTGISSLEGP
jgi:hypothetical protein